MSIKAQNRYEELVSNYCLEDHPAWQLARDVALLELQVERLSQMLGDRHVDEETIEEALADCLR